jgi:uncharacterized membrane protein HdeD (DUF308 family)
MSRLTPESVELLRRNSIWMLIGGVLLIALGLLAVTFACITGLIKVLLFGWFLALGGCIELGQSFTAGRWSVFLVRILLGLFHLVLGLLVLGHPWLTLKVATLVLAIFFVVGGVLRIGLALLAQMTHRWALLASGVLTLLMGVLIFSVIDSNDPESGLWIIGTFVGISLAMHGVWLVSVGITLKLAPPPDAAGTTPQPGGSAP